MDRASCFYLRAQRRTVPRKVPKMNKHLQMRKRRRTRKKICIARTLRRYYKRITTGPLAKDLKELEGAYLSTFKVFETETRTRSKCHNSAFVLLSICRERGINVKGVTSECKSGGVYRSAIMRDRHKHKIVYVDDYNYFTKHPTSKWVVTKEDRCYVD